MDPSTPQQPVPSQIPALQQPASAQDPGKTTGIVGFIFAFVGLQIPGLILSILGYKKSKRAGHANSLAVAGIILNSLGILVGLIVVPILIASTIVSYNAISLRANTSAARASATTITKLSEVYAAESSSLTYPTTLAATIEGSESASSITAAASPITSQPATVTTIEFNSCGSEGNKIGYWDYESEVVKYEYSGTATLLSTCTFSAE